MLGLLISFLATVQISLVYAACPTIVTRAAWGARAPKSVSYLTNPVHYAFIHHSEAGECNDRTSCAALVRSYQNYHMDTNGWADIGYSFLIGGDGSVFEGRGWDRVGAHTQGYNSVGYAFCFIGNFMTKLPTAAAQQAAHDIIGCGVTSGKIQSAYVLRGHRDMGGGTDCPGNTLYNAIRSWPHY
ncbi:unnamed protein product [Lymnaea stagnalis]|uniref:Peptidoglycan-recognition protein n=1 Tax=Lymnaea stagnalis TaxID=6523 RepID=A0AAV2HU60_LYMST